MSKVSRNLLADMESIRHTQTLRYPIYEVGKPHSTAAVCILNYLDDIHLYRTIITTLVCSRLNHLRLYVLVEAISREG